MDVGTMNYLERQEHDAKQALKALETCVNDNGTCAKLAELMIRDHNTYQQSFMRLFVLFVEFQANKDYTDLRNEASVNLAKTLNPLMRDEFLPYV